jgi:hypothetical protein
MHGENIAFATTAYSKRYPYTNKACKTTGKHDSFAPSLMTSDPMVVEHGAKRLLGER